MKTPWNKPIITRLPVTALIAAGLVFSVNGGKIKMTSLTLKQNGATVMVRPDVVAIKPQ